MKRTIFKISPRYDNRKLENKTLAHNFDDFVDVYEDRVKGWLLQWIHELNKSEHAGFAAIQLALAFFEGFAVFYDAKDSDGKSRQFFWRGFLLVFPQLHQLRPTQADSLARQLYRLGRCGLLHLSMVRPGFFLQDGEFEFQAEFDASDQVISIRIDRHKFAQAISTRFEQYIQELRDASKVERRQCFVQGWQIVHDPNRRPKAITTSVTDAGSI